MRESNDNLYIPLLQTLSDRNLDVKRITQFHYERANDIVSNSISLGSHKFN